MTASADCIGTKLPIKHMFSACLAASIQTMSSRLVPSWQWCRPTNHMGCGMSYISALMPCMHLPASLWGLRAKTHVSSRSCATCSCSHSVHMQLQSHMPIHSTMVCNQSSLSVKRSQATNHMLASNKQKNIKPKRAYS